jgi:TetR/AcrR family transcriptional regulator, mexJK operon transcriptional repressor
MDQTASKRAAQAADPRVIRSRTAVLDAARTLFLQKGFAGTTVDEIAELAGRTKPTVYNNFGDKEALFVQIVEEVIVYAEGFAGDLITAFADAVTEENVNDALHELGRHLALGIVRTEVVALRRLLIGESRTFPELAREYYNRAPGQVIEALASEFRTLHARELLRLDDAREAASQFAYLVAGEPLDRAVLAGGVPDEERLVRGAREGVRTFLARYRSL